MGSENTLRQIEIDDDVVVYTSYRYASTKHEVFEDHFERLHDQGKLRGEFDDDAWIGSSGIKTFVLDFHIKELAYVQHMKVKLNFTASQIEDMLKCYALSLCGELIFRTIQESILEIKRFLETYNGKSFHTTLRGQLSVCEFLDFIGVSQAEIEKYGFYINNKDSLPEPRELKSLINYLVISDIIQKMYSNPHLSSAEFIRWFPVYFWSQVTFIVPLRATEMLVTPFDCIRREGDKVFLRINRTKLKKKRHIVHYDPEKDYRLFEYEIPDTDVVKNIEKYMQMTQDQPRRFLFQYHVYAINEIFSLQSVSGLLDIFVDTYVAGNTNYRYAKFACGIEEFDHVNPGDSRVIAISNMLYQDAGLDICRQLADHENLKTTYGYAENVAQTIWASSVMSLQKKINLDREELEREAVSAKNKLRVEDNEPGCTSLFQPKITGNITDCIKEGHIDMNDCFGCRYDQSSESQIQQELEEREKNLVESSRMLFEMLRKKSADSRDLDKIFLDIQTRATRYKNACDRGVEKVWQRYKNTTKK